MKTIVILGAAREDGNTAKVIQDLCPFPGYELIDLRRCKIEPYDYSGASGKDDFLMVAKKMESAEVIIFATPVYWYAMSASLKGFFDRLSDLLGPYKTIGKSLKGKRVYLISTGSDPELPEGFEVPFRLTARYFDMSYVQAFYKPIQDC